MYRKVVKNILDFFIGLCGFPFFLIALIIFGPIIYFTDKGPIFYNANRIGKDGKLFKMYKFRSMYVNAPDIRLADGSTYNGEDDPRVTKIGKFLRATSIEGNDIIRQTTKSLINKGFREVSPIPFFNGCNLISNDFRVMIA